DADQTTGQTGVISLAIGEVSEDNDAGIEDPGTASLGDRVWFDENRDGLLNDGELGAEGVEVTLTGAGLDGEFGTADDTTATQTTDENGEYLFEDLDAGDYQVTFGTLDGYGFTTASDDPAEDVDGDSDAGAGGVTDTISLEIGEDERDVDAGLVELLGSIGDTVWFDTNENGQLDDDEDGADGVEVKLIGAGDDGVIGSRDDVVLETTTTANGGQYLFDNLSAGTYAVMFGTLTGFGFTQPGFAADDVVDGDSDAGDGGMTDAIVLSPGEDEDDIDAGLVELLGSIGDTVFFDVDGNGFQNEGEFGAEGVEVKLITAGDDGVFGTADDVIEATTTTDSSGKYLFDDLSAGDYKVMFGTLDGFTFTEEGAAPDGDVNGDSDAGAGGMTDIITLGPDEDQLNIDAGLVRETGTAALGDTIWLDLFGNGLLDDFEATIDGITVQLKDENGDVIAEQVTSNGGQYLFDELVAGTYSVAVLKPQLGDTVTLVNPNGTTETITLEEGGIEGFELTAQDAGDDTLDSD
ncbi:MAG: SdrD B-like domain-containing protein, partial [Planctomycetota bacterium]